LAVVAAVCQGCDGIGRGTGQVRFTDDYHAVLLSSGQVYFGKITGNDKEFLTLKDVYYIQSRVAPGTKDVSTVLIKRGRELHAPSVMFVRKDHVVIVEPVATDSRVASLIKEDKERNREKK